MTPFEFFLSSYYYGLGAGSILVCEQNATRDEGVIYLCRCPLVINY